MFEKAKASNPLATSTIGGCKCEPAWAWPINFCNFGDQHALLLSVSTSHPPLFSLTLPRPLYRLRSVLCALRGKMTWQAYPFLIICMWECPCVFVCASVHTSLHASLVQAFSLVALVPAFSDCCVLSTHTHTHRCTYTLLLLQSKLGIHSLPGEGKIGSTECLGGLPVLFWCVCPCGFVLMCVSVWWAYTSMTLSG